MNIHLTEGQLCVLLDCLSRNIEMGENMGWDNVPQMEELQAMFERGLYEKPPLWEETGFVNQVGGLERVR